MAGQAHGIIEDVQTLAVLGGCLGAGYVWRCPDGHLDGGLAITCPHCELVAVVGLEVVMMSGEGE